MKKIGIITLNGYFNFGNRLQNYALTKVLEKYGYSVDTIWSGPEINLKSKLRLFFIVILPYNDKWKRERLFYYFSKNNMNKVNLKHNVVKKYDAFVAGSDQVWNYESVKSNVNYLIPFSKSQKLISYAASMGNSDLPSEYIDLYYKYLSRFDNISVREETAKKLLINNVNLKNKEIEVLIDPTLLLNKDDWEKIENKPKRMISNNYILCYFLGDDEPNIAKIISNYAKKSNLSIINILDKKDPFYCSGPQEFIYLVHHASLVCTDSFHSCVFSFIYNVPFIAFKRMGEKCKMYSRINDFITKFKFKNREFNGFSISDKNINHDYSEAYKVLSIEREKSLMFLEKSFDIIGGDVYEKRKKNRT